MVTEEKVTRFDIHQRIQHLLLMISFSMQVVTGFPLKYAHWTISQWWVNLIGGIEVTRSIHHFFGYVLGLLCLYHIVYILASTFILKRPFPRHMFPNKKDFTDFFQEMGHFLGIIKEKPKFGRFNWREKLEYWAVGWGMLILGISGFIMAYSAWVTKFLPGWIVPVALIAHTYEALLALLWVIIVHIFFSHLTPGVFPFNTSIFTGKVPRERYQREHPLDYERLKTTIPR